MEGLDVHSGVLGQVGRLILDWCLGFQYSERENPVPALPGVHLIEEEHFLILNLSL